MDFRYLINGNILPIWCHFSAFKLDAIKWTKNRVSNWELGLGICLPVELIMACVRSHLCTGKSELISVNCWVFKAYSWFVGALGSAPSTTWSPHAAGATPELPAACHPQDRGLHCLLKPVYATGQSPSGSAIDWVEVVSQVTYVTLIKGIAFSLYVILTFFQQRFL